MNRISSLLSIGILSRAVAAALAASGPADDGGHAEDYRLFCERTAQSAFPSPEMVVGMAPSMVKIRPRGVFDAEPATNAIVRLARNERESVQILVAPRAADLSDVSVTVGDLVENDGTVFAASNVVCSPVGYVNVTGVAPYRVGFAIRDDGAPTGYRRETRTPERGWWPDPILGHLDAVDVKGRDLQSFWVRVTCPESQKAGIYRGAATVRARGVEPVVVPFTVRVNGFGLPKGAASGARTQEGVSRHPHRHDRIRRRTWRRDGTPLPTIRLENFRDGLEDYAYAKILEKKLCEVEQEIAGENGNFNRSPAQSLNHSPCEAWLRRAKAAIAVPQEVMDSMTNFTDDPEALLRWRDEMADLVEEATVKNLDEGCGWL